MNFEDMIILRLADAATRAALFDELALEQIVSAAYDTDAMPVEGPFQPLFDDFQLGFALPQVGTLSGHWGVLGGSERIEAHFSLDGLGAAPPLRVDALWRGAVVARTTPTTARVEQLALALPQPGAIDAGIIADLGALPQDPAALEAARRSRLVAQMRAGLDQPDALTDARFDRWLVELGARSVGELLTSGRGSAHPATARITFSAPNGTPPTPRALPIAAALLARDVGFSLAQLLLESKQIRERLRALDFERAPQPDLRARVSALIVWVVPLTVFNDDDWPGDMPGMDDTQRRDARRAAAGRWLAREGIGLVSTE